MLLAARLSSCGPFAQCSAQILLYTSIDLLSPVSTNLTGFVVPAATSLRLCTARARLLVEVGGSFQRTQLSPVSCLWVAVVRRPALAVLARRIEVTSCCLVGR